MTSFSLECMHFRERTGEDAIERVAVNDSLKEEI